MFLQILNKLQRMDDVPSCTLWADVTAVTTVVSVNSSDWLRQSKNGRLWHSNAHTVLRAVKGIVHICVTYPASALATEQCAAVSGRIKRYFKDS